MHACLSTQINSLLGTAFLVKSARNLALRAVGETLKFMIQMKRTKNISAYLEEKHGGIIMHGYHDLLPSAGDAYINTQFHKEKYFIV